MSLKYDEKAIVYQNYKINLVRIFCGEQYRTISNMQNIPNRMLMKRFLRCNNGSQEDVLPWKPCFQENLDN